MRSERNVWIENWSRNICFRADEVLYPCSTEEVLAVVKDCVAQDRCLRVIGNRGSQVPFVGSSDVIVSLKRMGRILEFDSESGDVCLQGGVTLRLLVDYLRKHGRTLRTIPGVLWQTVAGAVSTDTHGIGLAKNLLHDDVLEFTLIDGRGEVRVISRDDNDFDAAAVSLGLLGVIVEVRMRTVPVYHVKTEVRRVPIELFVEQYTQASFSKMYSWILGTDFLIQQSSEITESNAAGSPLRGRVAPGFNWLAGNFMACLFSRLPKSFRSRLVDVVTRGHLRIKDDRVGNTQAIASHLVCRLNDIEMACRLDQFPELLEELRQQVGDAHDSSAWLMANIRFAKASSAYLSLASGRDTAYISFWFRYGPESEVMEKIQDLMKKYHARPHWGKMHDYQYADLNAIYPDLDKFCETVNRYDPKGVFINDYCRRLIADGF